MKIFFLFLSFCALYSANSLRILMWNPMYTSSHSNFINTLSEILIEHGHQVVQIVPVINDRVKTSETKAEVIKVPGIGESLEGMRDRERNVLSQIWTQNDADPVAMFELVNTLLSNMRTMCGVVLDEQKLMSKLKEKEFDLGLSEPIDMCGYGLFHILGIPQHLTATSLFLPDVNLQWIGAPTAPSYVPAMSAKFGSEMTFLERLKNGLSTVIQYFLFNHIAHDGDYVFRERFGPDFPSLKDLLVNSTFFFTNMDPLIDFPHPTIHKIIDIGGIAVPKRSAQRLTEEWQKVLNIRKKNVLISFGTVAQSQMMPDDFKKGILETVRRFPEITFIWKYENSSHNIGVPLSRFSADTENVVTVEWIPQNELLSDPRVSGFITHGGAASTNEAANRGVPTICIPLFADQYRNGRMLERIGTSILFEKKHLVDPQKLYDAISQLVNDKGLTRRAKAISSMIEHRPVSMEEKFVSNVEFAASDGPFPQLDPHGRRLTFVQYFFLDVISFCLLIISLLIALFIFFVKWTFRCYVRYRSKYSKVE